MDESSNDGRTLDCIGTTRNTSGRFGKSCLTAYYIGTYRHYLPTFRATNVKIINLLISCVDPNRIFEIFCCFVHDGS